MRVQVLLEEDGRRDRVDRVVVTWPNGRSEESKSLATGRSYDWIEGKGIVG